MEGFYTMKKNKVLMFENVSKTIKKQEILKKITFDIDEGEVIGIIGENGCGKTTILRLASGLIYPTDGKIFVNNKLIEPGLSGKLPSDIGILIESPSFMDNLSGFENLQYLAKIKNKINRADIIEALNKVGLDWNNKKPVKTYSLGMKQRLGIAQAIMETPKLILFDEPTNGLDSSGVNLFEDILNKYKKLGISFILVSHNMDEIKKFCDRVFKIKDGCFVLQNQINHYSIELSNLEDLEIVLKHTKNASIGERYRGNPVAIIPCESHTQLNNILADLNINFNLIEEI